MFSEIINQDENFLQWDLFNREAETMAFMLSWSYYP